jgi:hypothetical protein
MCFNRPWTYPDSEIVDVGSEQDEPRFEEDEDDGVSNYTSDDSDSDEDEDPLRPMSWAEEEDILDAAVFVAEADVAVRARPGSKSAAETVYRHVVYRTLHWPCWRSN